MTTRHPHNFYKDAHHAAMDIIYGTRTGYPCCFSNMHQAWPEFTQSLWYTIPDKGIATLAYSPPEVVAQVGGGHEISIIEGTYYPMDDEVRFTIRLSNSVKGATFSFHLRIPEWCKGAAATIDGITDSINGGSDMAILYRPWKNGDQIILSLPMKVESSRWYENSVTVERGPLVHALKMGERWMKKESVGEERSQFGFDYYEVSSPTKRSYGILSVTIEDLEKNSQVAIDLDKQSCNYFWNVGNAPIQAKLKAKEMTP